MPKACHVDHTSSTCKDTCITEPKISRVAQHHTLEVGMRARLQNCPAAGFMRSNHHAITMHAHECLSAKLRSQKHHRGDLIRSNTPAGLYSWASTVSVLSFR